MAEDRGPDPDLCCITMLTATHHQLQRHRRKLLWGVAVLVVATAGLTAKTVLANAHADGEMATGVDDVAAICIIGAGCVAVIGLGTFAIRRPTQRPRWRLRALLVPSSVHTPVTLGFSARAGPPSSLLQIFRL